MAERPAGGERKIRVLFFTNSVTYAGVEEVIVSLAKGLDRRRFEVSIAAPQVLLDAFRPQLEAVEVEFLPILLKSWKQWREIRRFFGFLRRRRIDVLNCHMFYATFVGAPLARAAGVPVVIETGHGPEVWRPTWSFAVDRVLERFVTANISVSEAYRRFLIETKRFPAKKIHVIPNGRLLEKYNSVTAEEIAAVRERHGLAPDARVLVLVGRLQREKGHAFLLQALPDLVKEYPQVRVLFVGDGPLREALERDAAARGLGGYVEFVGFTRRVEPYYHVAEFVLLPSLHEGMPLVAIEAGAVGRALVGSAVDGTCEVVVDGETGVLLPPGAPKPLTAAIRGLLADPEKSRAMGAAARRRVERFFSLERQVEKTGGLFQEYCRIRGI